MTPIAAPAPSRTRPPRVTRTPAPTNGDVPPAPDVGTGTVRVAVAVGLAVGLAVGVAVAVAVAALGLADGEVGAGVGRMPEMQVDALMVSLMRVSSPVLANTRPSTVTPAPTVIEVDAMTVPTKVGASSVAELPICQNTLHGEAPSVCGVKRDAYLAARAEATPPRPTRTTLFVDTNS